jgi:YYY domain-containing protein
VFDWLAREGWIVVSWWALIALAGAAVFPLCARLLRGLPDRGYTLARAAGLLLVGFVFWLLASLGFLRNEPGSIILSWLIVLVIALAVYFSGRERVDWRAWWGENRRVVIASELLFLVLFFGWAIVRAHQNGIFSTEKPMDLAMMSAIQRSPAFPPNDPWLSGYAISYYYFGYLLSAMLSMMSGIPGTTGFNLNISMLFALTGLTTFGVVYNLVRARQLRGTAKNDGTTQLPHFRPALAAGVLAAVFVVLLGNFEASLIEWPYQSRTASEAYLRFWNIQERDVYPEREQATTAGIDASQPVTLNPGKPDPTKWDYWWWFRASRVLTDFNLDGTPSKGAQPIDEFPQFSFLLADNHPHVMALPFAALSLGLALNVLLAGRSPRRLDVIFYAIWVGALIFLNTWDGPIYMLILVGAEGLRRLMRAGRLTGSDFRALFWFLLALVGLSLLFYLPFLISFRSQASGILPNIITPTLPQQYFIMFGPFLLLLLPFVLVEARRAGYRMNWTAGLQIAGSVFVVLLFIALTLILVAMRIPDLYATVLSFVNQNGGPDTVWGQVLRMRAVAFPTIAFLLAGLVIIGGRLLPRVDKFKNEDAELVDLETREPVEDPVNYSPSTGFALLLVAAAIGLTLVPEFVYLRDNFGVRINTIFKFYYQAWLLFSVASAYAVYSLLADEWQPLRSGWARRAFAGLTVVILALGLIYPVFGIHNRMFIENGRATNANPPPLTLDGGAALVTRDDYNAIMCLQAATRNQQVVVAEVLGPAYNIGLVSARVASLTGIPIVLGWTNHERQWRGSTYDAVTGTREQDINRLYTDLRWDAVVDIIKQYGISYIFYGDSERQKYGPAGEDKFRENLEPVCESNGSRFYRVTEPALQVASSR